jgi:hypothetical protein
VPFKWNQPSAIWEALVRPLVPVGMRGVIWYQGEANTPRAHLYRTLFPTMIRAWREDGPRAIFRFSFVQLAHGGAPADVAADREHLCGAARGAGDDGRERAEYRDGGVGRHVAARDPPAR